MISSFFSSLWNKRWMQEILTKNLQNGWMTSYTETSRARPEKTMFKRSVNWCFSCISSRKHYLLQKYKCYIPHLHKFKMPENKARFKKQHRMVKVILHCWMTISAIAGILLKYEVYFFSVKFFVPYWIIQIFCSAVTVNVRIKFLKLLTTIQFSCDGTSEW